MDQREFVIEYDEFVRHNFTVFAKSKDEAIVAFVNGLKNGKLDITDGKIMNSSLAVRTPSRRIKVY